MVRYAQICENAWMECSWGGRCLYFGFRHVVFFVHVGRYMRHPAHLDRRPLRLWRVDMGLVT